MKCALCNGRLINKFESIEFNSKSIGKMLVPELKFTECQDCKDKIFTPEEFDKAIDFIDKKEKEAISNLPIKDFITANEAAEMLGITKQAFSKNYKIKRGLIYSVKIGGKKYYHKKSVELFKEKNNGKFLISRQELYINYGEEIVRKVQKTIYTKTLIVGTPKTSDISIESNVPSSGWRFLHQTGKKGLKNAYH
ncbi:MAG: hypothetical protein ABIK98_05885 [Pseudomonadota bacterium]|uniref:Helix-turn-helix domain-containing protein n=1 Tax=Candidatus Desulfatibia profunda TaxID=2841695 RepID=A0A8J6TKS3_9BACT|nr:helix-turn-helix domain-containing protein [Candidatus Desulfatibia profunda]